MMRVTYSLKGDDEKHSNRYYSILSSFADRVLHEAQERLGAVVDSYRADKRNGTEPSCLSFEEAVLELLIMGVLWNAYGARALKLNGTQYRILKGIGHVRHRSARLKPGMNRLKGIFSTVFLSDHNANQSTIIMGLSQLFRLIRWLEATGEFNNEGKRLKAWMEYLRLLPQHAVARIFTSICYLGLWFEKESEATLGEFTEGVHGYLADTSIERRWREDFIFCQRKRVEYHLNMVGAELMNRAFRSAFLHTRLKVLLLPVCMTSPTGSRCRSEGYGFAFKCKNCSPQCQVHQLAEMEEKLGIRIMVVPHESSISSSANQEAFFENDTGVIGVACVLNLISGGWLLKDMGVPAQCVLLEYCGCRSHWHPDGIPTCINLTRLTQLITQG